VTSPNEFASGREEGTEPDRRARVLHISTGLTIGGAENMLAQITARLDPTRFTSRVVSLTELGPMAKRIEARGVRVDAMEMRAFRKRIRGFVNLAKLIRKYRPHIIQTWLYHADLIGGLAAIGYAAPVIWNLRQSNLHPFQSKPGTRTTVKICSRLSGVLPDAIVCGSKSAYEVHASLGYSTKSMRVIPNGVDLGRFKPDIGARIAIREELGLLRSTPLVGLFARFDPQKDHGLFVKAAATAAQANKHVQFVLCGPGIDQYNRTLLNWINATGLSNRFHLLGARDDIASLTAALDVSVSSSLYGEGFSNTLTEALACGVPCVTTDVGDSLDIVGNCGAVVPPGDHQRLSDAIARVLQRSVSDQGVHRAARERAESAFDINVIISQYENLYLEFLRSRSPAVHD
jgi:glycosyltransferase involved in cell wall biosynthesis